jgi:hypothetical protein
LASVLSLLAVACAAFFVTGCDKESPVAPSPSCSFAVSANRQSFASEGGHATVSVATLPQCAWTATSSASWMTFDGAAAGTGTGSVTVVVAANTSEPAQARAGSIAVAGQTVAISQEAPAPVPCTFEVSPARVTHGADAGSGVVHVTAAAACSWTAASNDDWLIITSGQQGQGEGDIAYTFDRNTKTSERIGTIVAAGHTVEIAQAPAIAEPEPPAPVCNYSVTPVEFGLHWHHTGGEIALSVKSGCGWTVSAGAEWLNLATPSAGSGAATINFTNSIFTADGSRRAPVQIRWPTLTAGQNVWVTQEGCRYGVSETLREVPAAGGNVTMFVLQQAVSTSCGIPCPWTAVPNVPWIQIVTSMPHAGDDALVYRVDANNTGVMRLGTIRIESQSIMVRQAAQAP